MKSCVYTLTLLALIVPATAAPSFAQADSSNFAPLTQWETAIRSGNAAALKSLYSVSPGAQISVGKTNLDADADIAFWTGLKVHKLKVDVVQSDTPAAGARQLVLQTEVESATSPRKPMYVTEGQLWQQQGEQWKLISVHRTEALRLQQPATTTRNIYAPGTDAHAEISEALGNAAKDHKRVILVFGANWCYDCHVLDLAFHRPDIAPVVTRNYEVVHVDVGEFDKNLDLMAQYNVPKSKGIPGVAVLDSSGKLLYSQTNGEFEKARSLAPEDVLAFLNQWKPSAR